jgi:hypothetical protein
MEKLRRGISFAYSPKNTGSEVRSPTKAQKINRGGYFPANLLIRNESHFKNLFPNIVNCQDKALLRRFLQVQPIQALAYVATLFS